VLNQTEAMSGAETTGKTGILAQTEAIGIAGLMTICIYFSEAIGIVDAIATSAIRRFTEAIGLVDVFRKAMQWIEEIKNTVTWTEEKKSDDDMWDEETKI